MRQRYDVIFTGRVQGVFFRATAEKIAQSHDVAGWVRNEPDGTVHLLVEGESAELDRFIQNIEQAKRENITNTAVTKSDATGEFDGFRVRY